MLARAVREVEAAVKRGRVSPTVRAEFQAIALVLREERARVQADTTTGQTRRAEQLKRLDGIATILATTAVREAGLFTGVPPEVERACAALQYQGIYCLNLGIDRPDVSDTHWVYFYEDPFPFHRLSFPATFSPDTVPPGKSSIATEVAFSQWRPLDRDTAVEKTIEALRLAKILRPDDRIELVHTEEILPAYIIYDLDHAKNVGIIRSWLRENGIWNVGRFGEWQYFNMDHSMRSGKTAAEQILQARVRA